MKRFGTPDGRLALVCICLAGLALIVWIPLDIETGLVEKARRRIVIGDAMLPAVGLGFVVLGSLLALVAPQRDLVGLVRGNLAFLARLLGALALALLLMRWVGPLAVDLFGSEGDSYRVLRDTAPWKYLGFVAGGTAMVAGLIALVEGRVGLRAVLIGLVASCVLVGIYDLPFEDLQLPPNGDV